MTNANADSPLYVNFSADNPLIKKYKFRCSNRRFLFGYYLPEAYVTRMAKEAITRAKNEDKNEDKSDLAYSMNIGLLGLKYVENHLREMSASIGAGDEPFLDTITYRDEISSIIIFYTNQKLPPKLPTEELLERWKEALIADGCGNPQLGWFFHR